ncbi:MAG TPA: response regulator transcription factor [Clostridia bacterium]|nr:response regulator transcription factor [Clostridia bacterium]
MFQKVCIKARVLLVDEHPIVRRGLRHLLSLEPDMQVCAEADSPAAAQQELVSTKPDLAVVDVELNEGSGLALIHQMHALSPQTGILVFSMHNERIFAERTLRAGARGYVMKNEQGTKVVAALRNLMAGKLFLSQTVAESMLQRAAGIDSTMRLNATGNLSDRELEVLRLLGRGLGSRDIAACFHVSIKTVHSHREKIKEKLGLRSASELMRYAFTWSQPEPADQRGFQCIAAAAPIENAPAPLTQAASYDL